MKHSARSCVFFDGDVPTKQYSDILQKIFDDPRYYDQILEENFKTEASYKKSKKAVYKLLGNNVHKKTDHIVFSSSELAVLESVAKHICCYSGKVLEEFTHSEAPWLSARGELSKTKPSDRIITKETIGTYFESVKENYNMMNPNTIKAYTQAMFQQR